MAAEYKVSGGKLLRADVVASDTIQRVTLHGDFFIYPETVRNDIEAALEGQHRDADVDTLGAAVAAAVPDDAELVGFSPADVATVVQQAVRGGVDE